MKKGRGTLGACIAAAARELAKYKLDIMGVQEVRWDKRGTVRAGDCNFLSVNETKSSNWEQDYLYITE
jgi:hypothetical protein